jgi:LacI family transcriptional regulator
VSGAARERVLAAAAALKYRPNVVARDTRTGRTSTVGVVVADIGNPFFGRSTRAISDSAEAVGFKIVVVNTDEDIEAERAAIRLLLEQRVAGIIVAPASRNISDHLSEAQATAPVVLLDRRVRGLESDRVFAGNEAGARQAMRVLLEHGHRRIAYVSSAAGPRGAADVHNLDVDDLITSGGDRIRAYLECSEAAGVTDPRAYLALCPFGEDAAYEATAELLSRSPRPSAIFASDGVIALGVLRAIHDAGLRIPDDVSVVAGDEPSWSRITTPPLSTVVQPVHDLGTEAMDLLWKRLADPGRPWQDRVLPTRFVIRGSLSEAAASQEAPR